MEFFSGRELGLAGVGAILLIAILFSNNRLAINPRVVVSAFALQAIMAWFVLATPVGAAVIGAMSTSVTNVLHYADAGISMLFGPLADSKNFGVVFAFQVLPIVVFFSSLMSVLYHLRVMQVVVAGVGGLLRLIIGTRPVESLNAAANIFVGQTEAPLSIKPYLDRITGPQLFAIMVSGLASVAGSVLAAYAQIGIELKYLLAASFMSAPGGLLMAKLLIPDGRGKDEPKLDVFTILKERSAHANVIMAAAIGAKDGLALALNIGAMLLAFTGLIALLNGLLGALGAAVGVDGLSAQMILGWLFAPLMALLNIPLSDAVAAGGIFGEKIILNEFIAYFSLIRETQNLEPRTVAVLTFALCGFANISSIAILLGGLGSMMPERMGEIARFGLRAVLAGSLSNLMSAALAGLILP